jgi:hypothetical protein
VLASRHDVALSKMLFGFTILVRLRDVSSVVVEFMSRLKPVNL